MMHMENYFTVVGGDSVECDRCQENTDDYIVFSAQILCPECLFYLLDEMNQA